MKMGESSKGMKKWKGPQDSNLGCPKHDHISEHWPQGYGSKSTKYRPSQQTDE